MFNGNLDGVAPNLPCTPDCKDRNAYCHSNCEKYKNWQIIQKQYSNKVKWIKRRT